MDESSRPSHLPADEAGFTLVEVLVAAMILVTALLGMFLMVDVTARVSRVTAAREAGVSLVREIAEDARSIPYSQIGASDISTYLQAMPGLANQAPAGSSAWQVIRRGVTFNITVSESDLAAVTGQTTQQKQLTLMAQWNVSGTSRSYSETITISSAGQGIGMSATSLQWANAPASGWSGSVTQPVITSSSITSLTFSVQTPPNASGVRWTVNGVVQPWTATVTSQTSTAWTWTLSGTSSWNISSLPDGAYEIAAAAQNGGITGPAVILPVKLSRAVPLAPVFISAGYDTVNAGGVSTGVADLDWTGSNPGESQIVGYQIIDETGTLICQTTLASQATTLSYPAQCGMNGNTVWCQTPTACIDLTPPDTVGGTYTVAPLYYDSSGTLQAGNAASVQLSSTTAPTYPFATTTNNTKTNCQVAGPKDMSATYTPGSTDTKDTAKAGTGFCAPAYTSAQTVPGGGTEILYFTTGGSGTCTFNSSLDINGSTTFNNVSISVPSGITTPTAYTVNFPNTGNISLKSGDRQALEYTWSCSGNATLTLHYGSAAYNSRATLGGFAVPPPSPPTSLHATTNADGSATLTWTASTSGSSVSQYRIYRDGTDYTNRYDNDTPANLCSGTSCSWTDSDTTAGTHNYYVTAVGTASLGSNTSESTFLGPVTG